MTQFSSVPIVGSGTNLSRDIADWSVSEPLRALVSAFGGSAELFEGDAAARLRSLDEFSDRWDSRRGLERNLATAMDLTAEQEALTLAAAPPPAPPHRPP